jgi:hypothetical protein
MEGEVKDIIAETPPAQVEQGGLTETQLPVEENITPETSTENGGDDNNKEVKPEEPPVDQEPTVDRATLEAKLREYELKEQEANELRDRLGIEDDGNFHLDSLEASLDNQFNRQWIMLCNKYGVDHTEAGAQTSLKELEQRDVRAYYEFKEAGKELLSQTEAQRGQIRATRISSSVSEFVKENETILQASPVVNNLISNYLQTNAETLVNPKEQLNDLMSAIKMIYAEAVEVGKRSVKLGEAINDKSGVNGSSSVATANTSSYDMSSTPVITREQIRKMSTEEFDKNYKLIEKLYREGKIQ